MPTDSLALTSRIGFGPTTKRRVDLAMLGAQMRTVLRHTGTGLYLRGPERWTANPDNAYDFHFAERAREFAGVWELQNVEVTFAFEDSQLIGASVLREGFEDAA